MKTCYKCKEPHKGSYSYCASCRKEIDAQYNKRRDKAKKYAQIEARAKVNKAYILDYLESHPCEHCGNNNPIVLEFHHLKDKRYNVSEMPYSYSMGSIKKEIEKCQVLCANCHRIVTFNERKRKKKYEESRTFRNTETS